MLSGLINEQGFAVIHNVLTQSEVDTLLPALRDVEKIGRAGTRHLLKNPVVRAPAEDARLLSIVQEVLGLDAFPFKATLFTKSSSTNWLVTWHQDKTLPLQQKRDAIGWSAWSKKEDIVFAQAPATELQKILALRIHLD